MGHSDPRPGIHVETKLNANCSIPARKGDSPKLVVAVLHPLLRAKEESRIHVEGIQNLISGNFRFQLRTENQRN